MNTEEYTYKVGDTVVFRYQRKEDSEGAGKIERREIGGNYTIRIHKHPHFKAGSAVKFWENEIVEKTNID